MPTKLSQLPANQQIAWAAATPAVTVSTPLLDAQQTWNAGAVTFTGLKLNVTDTASASGSLLLDLQVAASSKFSVDKTGTLSVANAIKSNVSSTAGAALGFFNAGLDLGSIGRVTWSSGAPSGSPDLLLQRDAANTLALRNGVSAQTLNVYNTFTDASNYERVTSLWTGGILRLQTEQAGTGAARAMEIGTSGANYLGFRTGGSLRFYVDGSTGHFLAQTDNTNDIGASGANRPRNYFGGGYVQTGTTTVASLPAASSALKGARYFVTDANATTFNSTVAAGGANNVPVVCNGTAWVIG